MRKSNKKRLGYIFIPIIIPPFTNAEHFLKHSSNPDEGWKELGQILQALRSHDRRIEDQLFELMEIYLPSEIVDNTGVEPENPSKTVNHFLVVQEYRKPTQIFIKKTNTKKIDDVIAPSDENDFRSVVKRLKEHPGELTKVTDLAELKESEPPYDAHAVRVTRSGDVRLGGYT